MAGRRLLLALSIFAAAPLPASAWIKTYVVDHYEAANLYGGPANGGSEAPGTDCPKGVNDPVWEKELASPHRPATIVDYLLDPETPSRLFPSHAGFRGENGENVYENPTSVPEAGDFVLVEGVVAEGFDLDDNPKTGFTSPDGKRGIDNAFYKVSGCTLMFRERPRKIHHYVRANEAMYEGVFTTVVVVTGEGSDPMNDPNVTVGFYPSSDKLVRDAHGEIAWDYTFKAVPDPNYSAVFKASISNGVLESADRFTFRSADSTWPSRKRFPLRLEGAKVRLQFNADGSVEGLVGGYRSIGDHYRYVLSNGDAFSGGTVETQGHVLAPEWFYAMRRAADGPPDPLTGVRSAISTAYRYHLVPAIVVTPAKRVELPAIDPAATSGPSFEPLPRDEAARLALASFMPITNLSAEKRELRRVSFRDPFGATTLPSITIEQSPDGRYGYTLTANAGAYGASGSISAEEWRNLVADDWALSPRRSKGASASYCISKEMVIEASIGGRPVRREASICGGDVDRAAVLYGYKLAALVINNSPDCRGFINGVREPSWALGECLRQQAMTVEQINLGSTFKENGDPAYAPIVIDRRYTVAASR